jgi:hypothetical protein
VVGLAAPIIPDHELVHRIGAGSYGEVWLARNAVGTYRAVKVVYRRAFGEARPYEREFEGVRYYASLPRIHDNLVWVLHVGRREEAGLFYYVMELADDVQRGTEIDATHYEPRTLSADLHRRGRLPLSECCQLGLALSAGLGHLHHQGLIHRDVKPANIIFVRNTPKFADIGLVTKAGEKASQVCTPGYAPQDRLGQPSADLYGLAKVLYEAFTGNDLRAFPELPKDWKDEPDLGAVRRFNDILLRACDPNPRARFQSAREMFEAMHEIGPPAEATSSVLRKWFRFLWPSNAPTAPLESPRLQMPLECPGGAMPLDSPFYILRPADEEIRCALQRGDSIILVRGARQMGKTSLLARGLQQAREEHSRVAVTDFQEMNDGDLVSLERFYVALAESLGMQLGLGRSLADEWDSRRSENLNFERFVRQRVLETRDGRVCWGLDEVDRLFSTSFGGQVFAMFRAWHNRRALIPGAAWSRLTLVLAYATEAHLFITDLNQSPFNVGTSVVLEDFGLEQVAELNRRYGSPLRSDEELRRFTRLLDGQPYLTRRGLYEMVAHAWTLEELEAEVGREGGVFSDHLRRVLLSLESDPELARVMCDLLAGPATVDLRSFHRLRSAGLIRGESVAEVRPRCLLYADFLRRHLG